MSRQLHRFLPAFVATFAFLLVNAAPSPVDMFGVSPAFAKKDGNGKGGGGSKSGGKSSKSNKGNKSKNKSAGTGIGGNGKSATAPGKTKLKGTTTLASTSAKALGTKTPKSVVRQYVLANGLKQGEVASLLKSWNSLNRNPQAYLNNMDNPNSLPGLQVAYIRGSIGVAAALDAFEALGGDPLNPPTETDLLAAQDAIAAQDVLDAQAVLAEEAATPGTHTPEEIAAATATVVGYAGEDPQTVVDAFAAGHSFDAATVIDQFNSWTSFQGTEAAAQDAFMAASVSYKGGVYDEAVFGELRQHVDAIVEMKGLDTLVADFDAAAAAAAAEPVEPTEPEESTDPAEPEIILPE